MLRSIKTHTAALGHHWLIIGYRKLSSLSYNIAVYERWTFDHKALQEYKLELKWINYRYISPVWNKRRFDYSVWKMQKQYLKISLHCESILTPKLSESVIGSENDDDRLSFYGEVHWVAMRRKCTTRTPSNTCSVPENRGEWTKLNRVSKASKENLQLPNFNHVLGSTVVYSCNGEWWIVANCAVSSVYIS